MADLELSLDEIIKKRNIKTRSLGPKPQDNRRNVMPLKRLSDGKKQNFNKKPIIDARYKIMNNKFRITGDARDRLEAMRKRNRPMRRMPSDPISRFIQGRIENLRRPPMDNEMFDLPPRQRQPPLMRTIDNHIQLKRQPFDWDRPVEDDEDTEMSIDLAVDRLRRNVADPTGFRPSIPDYNHLSVTLNNPRALHVPSMSHHAGILKNKPAIIVPAPAIPPRSGVSLSERFNRDRNAEAAVKVEALKAQLKAAKGEFFTKTESGHRIVVSNLVHSVTHEDVKELFADIGELLSSKLVRPGVAEVVYVQYEDAAKAVDVYHNRQLDGQPMKCLLVKNQGKKTSRPFVELDMATLRNALHKKLTS